MIGKYQIAILLFSSFSLSINCKTINKQGLNSDEDSTFKRTEYLINYSNGKVIDTVIKSIAIMNSQKKVIEEKRYYKGKYLNSIKYENGNLFSSINDSSILYVLSKKKEKDSLQLFYFNKLLVEKKFFNTYNDLVRDIIYGIDSLTNKDSLLKEYVYKYKNIKIVSESCYINKEIEYSMDYKYNNEGRLVEKDYSFERCCDKGQPIPNDKVIYKYDASGNLVREDYIIDRSIIKEYKNKFDGYFDQVKTIEYSYDKKNRLINKAVYKENYNSNPSIPISSLMRPRVIDQDYYYIYTNN